MKNELFKELQDSIIEGGKILKGKKKVAREFNFVNPDPKEIMDRFGFSQKIQPQ